MGDNDESQQGRDDPATIRAEIEDTRARMSETLGELGERLNPAVVKERVKESIREATFGRMEHMARKTKERLDDSSLTLMETIRENPVPAALVAFGIGWLIVNGRRTNSSEGRQLALQHSDDNQKRWDWYGGGERHEYEHEADDFEHDEGSIRERASSAAGAVRERAGEIAHSARERVGDMAHLARERAGEWAHTARDRASDLTHKVKDSASRAGERVSAGARDTAHRTSERARDVASNVADTSRRQAQRVEHMYDVNPLGVGLAVAAAGFAIGLSAPRSRAESRLVGDSRDRFVDKVKDMAMDKKERVQHVAERVIDEGKRTAKEVLRDEGLIKSDQAVS